MFKKIVENVVYPLAGRIGTSAATALVTLGVSQQHADWVSLGIVGLAGVGLDLISSFVRKRAIIDKTFNEVVKWLAPEGAETK